MAIESNAIGGRSHSDLKLDLNNTYWHHRYLGRAVYSLFNLSGPFPLLFLHFRGITRRSLFAVFDT